MREKPKHVTTGKNYEKREREKQNVREDSCFLDSKRVYIIMAFVFELKYSCKSIKIT